MNTTTLPRRSGWPLMVAGLLTSLLAALILAAPAAGQIEVGETPEAPTLETLDGDPVDLSTVFGQRPAVVEFWATWCAVCRAMEPELRAAHEAYGDRVEFLVVAVGVSQNPGSIRQHLHRHPLPGRVLYDARGRAARAFEAPGTGFIVILDENGEAAYVGTGPDQDIRGALADIVDGE